MWLASVFQICSENYQLPRDLGEDGLGTTMKENRTKDLCEIRWNGTYRSHDHTITGGELRVVKMPPRRRL
jgi:hypothetical protein